MKKLCQYCILLVTICCCACGKSLSQKANVTPDMKFAEVQGPVKAIIEPGAITYFNRNGQITSITNRYTFDSEDRYLIQRNSDGQIIRIKEKIGEEGEEFEYIYIYDAVGYVLETIETTPRSISSFKFSNHGGLRQSARVEINGEDELIGTVAYSYLEFDAHGNWTKKKNKVIEANKPLDEKSLFYSTREIIYWGENEPDMQSEEADVPDNKEQVGLFDDSPSCGEFYEEQGVEEIPQYEPDEKEAFHEEEMEYIQKTQRNTPPSPPVPVVEEEVLNVVEDDVETEWIEVYDPEDIVEIALPVEETEEELEDVVFYVVESMPEFPGGTAAMYKFIGENLKYPLIAQENGIQGRVVCQFTVEKDGSFSDIEVVRSAGDASLDKEAVRIIKSMPKWKPGKQRGQIVRVKYSLPITFKLQ